MLSRRLLYHFNDTGLTGRRSVVCGAVLQENQGNRSQGQVAMITSRLMGTAVAISLAISLAGVAPLAQGEDAQDLAPCQGSAPEPTQSAAWPVAFCNRTGHDIVIEFHDNDCPARNWDRRGDVYQRMLRRGESKTLPLCYANEPQTQKPAPGIPTLRIPGGKGVVTTWSVVGDCGDRSKPLNLDARTFYDRGEYKTGIILLQYPSGASHCSADASSTSAPTVPAATSAAGAPSATTPANATTAAGAAAASGAPTARPGAAASPAATPAVVTNPRSSESPTLTAAVDTKDVVGRTVRVFAKGGAGYKCNFNLALIFTDGGTWNDRAKADITAGDADAPIATRKYLKSVSKVEITSNKCSPP